MEQRFDLCIAGAGMAGATMASFLAPKGYKIAIIDKDFDFKDRIVAELLQPGAVNLFKEMGLDSCLEGFDAQEVYGYAMIKDGEAFQIPYNEDGTKKQIGIGVNSGLFLQKIRDYLGSFDNVTFIKGNVTELRKQEETVVGITYYDNDKEEHFDVDAKLTIASDGFYSRLRKVLSDNEVSITSHFIGVLMKNADLPFPNHGHLFLSGPTPFVCYPINSREIRCLVDFPSDIPPRRGVQINEHLEKNVIPYLPKEVQPAFINAYKGGKFKVMANQLMPAKPRKIQGAVLLGDSLNMRHPLTGGGLTAIFQDIKLLGDALMSMPDFEDQELIFSNVKKYYKERVRLNANVNILANALYGVMSNDLLKVAVYEYLKKGGTNASIPIKMLAGLDRDTNALIKHFFAVAGFGAKNLLSENVMNLGKAVKIMKDAIVIVKPLAISNLINIDKVV
tara:strand:+ start:3208 stop:4551 length:1344 start_codon:yes stop_codon:yes gene_type:complete